MVHQPDIAKTKDLRVFGLIWAGILLFLCFQPLIVHGEPIRPWAFYGAACFAAIAGLAPGLLGGFYKVWMKVGRALGAINSRILLGLMFVLMVTPMAVVMRLAGRDPLKRRILKEAATYWEPREQQPGPMENQF